MKITAIKSVVVNAQMRNWVFVKVETDQAGLVGWGEASLEWKTRAVVGAIEDLAPMAVGEDPTRIEHVYQKLYRQSFWRMGVIGMSAISGIEQACWDVLGKSLYESFDPGPVIELAQQVVVRGYTALKVVCVPYSEPLMSVTYVRKFAEVIGKLREAVGDSVDIMIDFHGRTTPAMAVEYINAVAEFSPFFCEEPVPPENVTALAEVKRAVSVPIATGERLVTRHQFREIFEQQACHVVQPDLCHCGGLLEGKKIAAMAEAYLMGVAPHNPLGPVANAVALHFALSTPNFLIQEDMLTDVPWRWDVVQHSLETRDGYWLKTETPGLGVSVNEKEAAKYPFRQEVMHSSTIRAADGAILDW